MSIAVTGASGQLGRLVAEGLLARVPAHEVVLLTRDPARLADLAARGAEVRVADFDRPDTLPAAFAGVRRALLISTDAVGDRIAGHVAAVRAAETAGVEHLAYTSVTRPEPTNPAAVVPDHAATEEALRASGLAWTLLRNNLYADMQGDALASAIASGRLVTNAGDGATAYVTRADCAAVAVGVLTGEGHEGRAYDVTGPRAWTAEELAGLASRRGGRPVEVVHVDDAAYAAGLASVGLPAEIAGLLASFGASAREGYLAAVSDVVATVGGVEPTPLESAIDG
ncbi:SDR family oxidoreductase [Nocardioides sp. TRM66260-LWL]|uniref:SDR family oxidoreductase n=1 Tax=Nocardioides sp. TRM66260-LWL TaxID=2874478 RepID=UPI001CC7FFC0|nr:SDR family oxidoreductase [Nocardioides sp. TRM66260-LWL]MBZ5734223.1 SDR family oxidoreductase [Nocardioides sp. TRM66260-LWL]